MDAFKGGEKPSGVNNLLALSLCQQLALHASWPGPNVALFSARMAQGNVYLQRSPPRWDPGSNFRR